MGLLDKGWGPGFLIGAGVAFVAPAVLPAAGAVVRPLAKALIVGCLATANTVTEIIAEAKEQMTDLVAEAKAERAGMHERTAESSRTRGPLHA